MQKRVKLFRAMENKTLLIGLTGGIGAGKSAVAEALKQAGYPVISADSLAREVTAANSPALAEICEAFGENALLPNGQMNRPFIRAQILAMPSLRAKLDSITHPRIQALAKKYSQDLFQAGNKIIFYEAPLLLEAHSETVMDSILCVFADDELRIARVMQRDHCDRASAEKMLRTQMPQEEKKQRSDYLIENNGDEKSLESAVKISWQKLLPATEAGFCLLINDSACFAESSRSLAELLRISQHGKCLSPPRQYLRATHFPLF